MSLKLELIAVEFPIGYDIELVKSFINSHDKLKYNEKFHFKNHESQIIFQSKKHFDFQTSKTIKHDFLFGDDVFQHTPTFIFSTENPELTLKKMAPRGSKVAGTETGRGHKSKKACTSCVSNCCHLEDNTQAQ